MLTQDRLKELLTYDPVTGEFRWLKKRRGVRSGEIAGNCSDGYRRIRIDRLEYKAHRLAWLYVRGQWPGDDIDHINGDPGDNRLCNLREANHAQNMANQRRRKDNTSGRKGVARSAAKRPRWRAHFRGRYLGSFATEDDAHAAYKKAASAHFGLFARYG